MPVYEYEILGPRGEVRGIYEVEQKISESALSRHPETGEPLRRILSSTFGHASSSDVGCGAGACATDGGCVMGGPGCGGGSYN